MMKIQRTTTVLATILILGGAFACGRSSNPGTGPNPGATQGMNWNSGGFIQPPSFAEIPGLPASLPGAGEIWVIEEGPRGAAQARKPGEEAPGSGALLARRPGDETGVPVPLEHTEVVASLHGYISTVDVLQRFHNPYQEKIEAIYVFPLPHDSAVRDFVMVIGERRIRGIIREKEEARRIYQEARSQGYRAALLTQARPNIFEQAVANIEPGHEIDIRIRYFHTLPYAGGSYEFVFPMVVGPRYNPPGWSNGIGAVAASNPGSSSQPTSVPYLRPGQRSGHDISITVEVDAGVNLEDLRCISHPVEITRSSPSRARIALAERAVVPNRDFVLRIKVAGESLKTTLLTHRDERGGFFTMTLYPPAELADLPRQPMEMIFVLDCSGSMMGVPLAQAKAAAEMALRRLGPDDTFQIIRFSDSASAFAPQPVPATEEHRRRGLQYLESLNSGGGTQALAGIRAALGFRHESDKLRFVAFLTDGYIGNEVEIFAEIEQRLGATRVFSLGVGSSVNRYLLEGMARLGRGAVAYILHDEDPGRAIELLLERITHPALTDLRIDWGNLDVHDVYPSRLPDLFVGRPVVVTGRFAGDGPATVRVLGRTAGVERSLAVALEEQGTSQPRALPALWARRKIQTLSDLSIFDVEEDHADQIRRLALSFGLLSDFTSYVAVDASGRTAGDHGTTLPVPLPMPAGVRYQTTVGK